MAKSVWKLSFLVDIVPVPRDVDTLPTLIRARVKDLSSAKDRGRDVGSIAEIEEVLEARLDAEGISPRQWERP